MITSSLAFKPNSVIESEAVFENRKASVFSLECVLNGNNTF